MCDPHWGKVGALGELGGAGASPSSGGINLRPGRSKPSALENESGSRKEEAGREKRRIGSERGRDKRKRRGEEERKEGREEGRERGKEPEAQRASAHRIWRPAR